MSEKKDKQPIPQAGLKTGRLRLTRRGFIRLCILGVLGLAGGRGFMNSRALSLSRIEVRLNRLPSMFNGLKVGQITDIHVGPLVSQAQLRMGVDLLQAAQPDLVALTGDGGRSLLIVLTAFQEMGYKRYRHFLLAGSLSQSEYQRLYNL